MQNLFSHLCFCCKKKHLEIYWTRLSNKKTIRQLYSFLLLLVFSVSIVPKIYFHDVVANHKDTISVCDHPEKIKACLHQTGYNCHVDELVVNTPYVILSNVAFLLANVPFSEFHSNYSFFIGRNFLLHKEGRGPPMFWSVYQGPFLSLY